MEEIVCKYLVENYQVHYFDNQVYLHFERGINSYTKTFDVLTYEVGKLYAITQDELKEYITNWVSKTIPNPDLEHYFATISHAEGIYSHAEGWSPSLQRNVRF